MARDSLLSQALALSSGTLATLTGLRTFTELDAIQTAFVQFCDTQPQHQCWQEAWNLFCSTRAVPIVAWHVTPPPRSPADDLEQLASIISQCGTEEQKQRDRATAALAQRGKLAPTKPQAEPVGLFENVQQNLFGQ